MARPRTYLQLNLVEGLRTPLRPEGPDWVIAVAYGGFAVVAGLATGLLHPEWPSWFELLILPLLLVVYPSLIEEVLFRGILLPRSLRRATALRRFLAVSGSTALFVAMHPLNAVLVGLSDTSQFLEPAFLVIVAALGYACAYLYLRSGSLWAPIALHWSTVVAWNLFLGREFEA